MKKRIKMAAVGMIVSLPLFLFALLALCPLWFLFTGTLMGTEEIRQCIFPVLGTVEGYAGWKLIPQYPTFRNVVELFFDAPEFFQMFWNSVKIVGGGVVGQLLVGVPAAWGLARYDFPGRKTIYLGYIILMMMPFQVTMLSEYLVLEGLGMLDTPGAVILPAVFSTFPVFIMYRFFCGLPDAILQAARVDGAGEVGLFLLIGVPMGSGGILAALLLWLLECYGMVEQPLTFLRTKSLWPLTLYLPEIDLGQSGFALCASFFALLPAVLVFLCGQEYLEQGIVAAAIKE